LPKTSTTNLAVDKPRTLYYSRRVVK